jgi:5-methylthioadenosine/S-adenosylhomocysteine deaminase
VVLEDGLIRSILPHPDAARKYPGAEIIDLPGHVLLPGLINMHTHSPMSLLRGYADDMDLHTWLNEHIWPAEKKFVGPGFVADGTDLAIAEMIRGGTTCFNELYFFPDVMAESARKAGIRAVIGLPLLEFATAWAQDIEACFEKGLAVHEKWRGDTLIRIGFAPHSPYTVSNETLSRVAGLSTELDMRVHIHLLETKWDISHSLQHYGVRPLERLHDLGLLNSRLLAVHMTQLSMEDIELLGQTDVQVIHCPQSNLKLASGICPVADLIGAGVNVSIGTDGAASNNDLDMLSEVQTAALLAKGISGDVSAVNAFQALEMITINGARALGLEDRTGSIEVGKEADLCALDLSAPETQPLHHAVSQLIYAASSSQISDVWVAGKRLLSSGELTTLDLPAILAKAEHWRSRLTQVEAGREAVSQ